VVNAELAPKKKKTQLFDPNVTFLEKFRIFHHANSLQSERGQGDHEALDFTVTDICQGPLPHRRQRCHVLTLMENSVCVCVCVWADCQHKPTEAGAGQEVT